MQSNKHNMSAQSAELPGSSSANSLLFRLQEALTSCCKSIEGGDLSETQTSVLDLVNVLHSVSEAAMSDPENEDAKNNALEVLSETYKFLCSTSLDQEVADALSFELPKVVSKFAGLSTRCLEISDRIIDLFIETCSPRDMLSILCEALDSLSKTNQTSASVSPLLSGLSKVFLSIQRRHFEQLKVAVPVIVKVLKAILSELDDADTELENLFGIAISIAHSMHAVSTKLEGGANEKLQALLGLYVLQIMALVSVSTGYKLSRCLPLVSQLACFLPYCGLSYLGLISGSDVDNMASIVVGEDEDNYMSSLPQVHLGASLSVIWGKISDGIAEAAKEDLSAASSELQSNQIKRWQAIGMLKHILSSAELPWELKRHAIDFFLCITNEKFSNKFDDEYADCSLYMISLFSSLQAVTKVIIYASDSVLRKKAFEALKRGLADIPTSQRFDILKALITNSDSSSMTAILLDLVREEMSKEISQKTSKGKDKIPEAKNQACQSKLFWSTNILELVELVLRPPRGGPPVLPEQGDAVLSALNLYRFTLIAESAGKTNCGGALSKNNLQKAYNEWLLPLRTLVTGVVAENRSDYDQFAVDTICALNPVELVLYRCIELVEENLRLSA